MNSTSKKTFEVGIGDRSDDEVGMIPQMKSNTVEISANMDEEEKSTSTGTSYDPPR